MIENGVNPEALAVSFFLNTFILQLSFSISSGPLWWGGTNYWMSGDKNMFFMKSMTTLII